jgi:RimJ/RimL family protein N-acetyltransferase
MIDMMFISGDVRAFAFSDKSLLGGPPTIFDQGPDMLLPVLTTERLILRPPQAEDFENWAKFCADEVTMAHLGGVQKRAEAFRTMCFVRGQWEINGFGMFSMIRRDTGEWIGRTGMHCPEGWPGTEIGWGVMRGHAGKGYAREAAVASIDYAFDVLGWTEVIHMISPENKESIALAERLGSRNLGESKLPAPFEDIPIHKYGQSKAKWMARAK